MNDTQWDIVKALLADALEQPSDARDAYLAERCGHDAVLRAEVQSLLDAHDDDAFMETPAYAHIALAMFGNPPPRDSRIGAFRIVREIGRGGMGTVYEAERVDGEFERRVAIKVVTVGLNSEIVVRRFRHERQILAELDHPNVARLLEGGSTADGLPYFVMEFIDGEPIDRYCQRQTLSVAARLALFQDVCAAVQYAHQRLVVHRDIKPTNVLVTADGVPKLLDFGIAKLLTTTAPDGMTTGIAQRPMTPAYASPEQLRGERATTLGDVYSLGVVLYQLLAGVHPYPIERCDVVTVARVFDGPLPARPSVANARECRTLRGDLDTIVMTAMHREPERRYPSVQALNADVQRYLRGQPIGAQPDTFAYRGSKFVRRNALPVALAATAVLALVVGTAGFAWQARVATRQRIMAEQRFTSIRKLALSMLFDVHDSIAALPGSTRARQFIVTRSLASLDALNSDAVDDPELRRDIASAYVRVGDVQGEPYHPNLGQTDAALANYRRASALLEPIVAAHPTDTTARHDLAIALMKIGAVRLRARDWNEAEHNERRSIALLESVLSKNPADSVTRATLANALVFLGDALAASDDLWSQGRISAALDAYTRALAVRLDLMRTHPASIPMQRSASGAYSRLGYAHSSLAIVTGDTSEFSRSLDNHRQAHALLARVLASDPSNADSRRGLADGQMDRSNIEALRDNYHDALALLDSVGPIFEALSTADPSNAEARRDLAYFRENRSALLVLLKEPGGAVRTVRAAIADLLRVQRDDPGSVEEFYHLAHSQEVLGDALALQGNAPGAVSAFESAIGTIRRWKAAEPNAVRASRLEKEVVERLTAVRSALRRGL